jgi:hypothetical protein
MWIRKVQALRRPSTFHAQATIAAFLLSICCCQFHTNNGANISTAGLSLAAVREAISSANPGDTVVLPEGHATWDDQLVITKGIILKGAGHDKTLIKGNMSSDRYLIIYRPSSPQANDPFRLTGITLDGDYKCRCLLVENLSATYPINKIRIDHNVIKQGPANIIVIRGSVYGVGDNNEIINAPSPRNSVMAHLALQQSTWINTIFDFGTAENFYWEDNIISTNDMVTEAGHSGRYCFRYNNITYTNPSYSMAPLFDAHGNQPGGIYSTMGVEIYENNITSPDVGGKFFDDRGGKALIYNNSITSASGVNTSVTEETHDNICPPANNPISGQPQHVSDSYYWNNTHNGIGFSPYIAQTLDYGVPEGMVPREDKHFWVQKSDFNGTSGMGVGPISSRPTTCTPGVAYWATDEKKLYRCLTPNVWTLYYVPYAYPHPLRTLFKD